jgi:hypothetical protein
MVSVMANGVVALVVAIALSGAFVIACNDPPTAPPTSITDVAVLPNRVIVEGSGNRLRALGTEGNVRWELSLPDLDTLAAPLAPARNSSVYARGAKAIHAVDPWGKVLWNYALTATAISPALMRTYEPVALPDSGVVLAVGKGALVSLFANGSERWEVDIPSGDFVGAPIALENGDVVVPTTTGVYAYSPTGSVEWHAGP